MSHTDGRRRAGRLLTTLTTLTTLVTPATLTTPAAAAVPAPATAALAAAPGGIPARNIGHTIAGRYIVVLRPRAATTPDSTARTAAALARRYGGTVDDTYRTAVPGFSAELSAVAARRLAADPAVAYVEADRLVGLAGTQSGPTWGLDRIDQRTLPLSDTYTAGSAAGVTAYVLDTGIRAAHTEFGGRVVDGWDFVDDDPVADDCHGHGTHVAGTIGGSTYGVAKDVTLVAVRVLDCRGVGSYSQIIAGIDWVAARGGRPAVANLSLGGPADQGLDDAVARSVAAGVTFVVAAGNAGAPACGSSPARAGDAITVGAIDRADTRAPFSNYGECVDIFAPGVRITSAGHLSDTDVAVMSGTSMAAPHVTGAAALVLGGHPADTPAQVRDALLAHAGTDAVADAGDGSPRLSLFTGWLHEPDGPPPGAGIVGENGSRTVGGG